MLGEVVGAYEITAQIGEGGMGVVYLAKHTTMGRQAVIKVLRPHLTGNNEMVRRFFNEAKAASSISHPGIVDVFDMGTRDDGSAYIVMDFLQGESLTSRLRRKGKLSIDEALQLVRQLLGALGAAHQNGIVHRDLKPDNIFIVPDPELRTGERIKLLDFGIAKLQGDNPSDFMATREGALMGTPVYMSLEQCQGANQCDHRTDLYAVGVILHQLLAGRPPFLAATPGEIMAAHMRDPPPSLRSRVPQASEALEHVVETLLAKSAKNRYSSCEAAIAAIDQATNHTFSTGPQVGAVGTVVPALDPMADTMLESAASTAGTTLGGAVATTRPSMSPAQRSRSRLPLVALAVLAVGGGASILFALQGDDVDKDEDKVALVQTDAGTRSDASPRVRLDGVPPISLKQVTNAKTTRSRKKHAEALKLHRLNDNEAALEAYKEAIQADPGHIVARYNYACLLNKVGKVEEGLELLRQLKEEACPVCLGRLVRARSDSEWVSARSHPGFIALTREVGLIQYTVFETATIFSEALTNEDLEHATDVFHPRDNISIHIRPEDCESKKCQKTSRLRGYNEVRDWLEEQEEPTRSGSPSCKGKCCSYPAATEPGLHLQRLCTSVDSGSVRTITSLTLSSSDP